MVCLAASIVSKQGKVLVSRQFVDMNRIRVEGLLAAFPKLVGTGKQHTYVETENVRYVYQPMEGLYLLLITNKQSNILEDLETLRLLSKVVPEYVQHIDEHAICDCAFELIFAFDEVISLGHKEEVTVAQVRQNTEMESNEEKLHKMIIQSKINDVNDVMKRKAQEIDRTKMDRKGSNEPWRTHAPVSLDAGFSQPTMDDAPSFTAAPMPSSINRPSTRTGPSKGMQLGKSKKNDILTALAREGEAVDTSASLAAPVRAATQPAIQSGDPINIDIEERLTVRMNKEGGLEQMEVQGTMTLLCTDAQQAAVQVVLQMGANAGMQFKTHPNIDKNLYSTQQKLGLKDPSRPFPTGVPLGVLKWRFATQDESMVPISVNCWPTASGAETYINIEYESSASYDLQQVVITIPGIFSPPKVNECDGDWRFDSRSTCVLWTLDLIDDSNRTGSMECVVSGTSGQACFPVTVSFSAKETLCDIVVPQVLEVQGGSPSRFSLSKILKTDLFEIVY